MIAPVIVRRVLQIVSDQHDATSAHQIREVQHRIAPAVPVMDQARIGAQPFRVLLCDPVEAIPFRRLTIHGPLFGRILGEPLRPVVIPELTVRAPENRQVWHILKEPIATEEREALRSRSLNLLQRETRAGPDADYRSTEALHSAPHMGIS
jgi:hypothetical protein